MKRVLFFGIYDRDYARNRVLNIGFRENGYEIVECNIDPKIHKGIKKYLFLISKYRAIKDKNFDLKIVCFPGQTIVPLARLLLGKKIIFDAFLSLYDSNVFDRRLYSRFSLKALRDYMYDYISIKLSYKVLLDTNEHIKYFKKTFGGNDKYIRVFVGTTLDISHCSSIQSEPNLVHFHGHYIPLHGIEYIAEAAKYLRGTNIRFNIIGRGQEYKKIKDIIDKDKIENINLIPNVLFEDLPRYICKAEICLGVFGKSDKVDRVIPNKVFEYSALGKVIISGESNALKEIYREGENIFTVPVGDGLALADKIKSLLNRRENIDLISKNVLDVSRGNSPKNIVYSLIKSLE